MVRPRVFLFIACFVLAPLSAQGMSSMNAVELNTAGFRLYEAGKFEECLKYFKASFEKDPEYGYPHYNYACVLSILKRGKGEITKHLLKSFFLEPQFREQYFKAYFEKDPEYGYPHYNYACVLSILKLGKGEITEHLLKSFFLEPQFREQYFSDPDLAWFMSEPDTGNHFASYFPFGLFTTQGGIDAATRDLMLHGSDSGLYTLMYPSGPSSLAGIDFTFSSVGAVSTQGYRAAVGGWWWISGNIIYIELDADIELRTETGVVTVRRFIWLLEEEGYSSRAWHGCILLPDSLVPFLMNDYYADPSWDQGV